MRPDVVHGTFQRAPPTNLTPAAVLSNFLLYKTMPQLNTLPRKLHRVIQILYLKLSN